jgi:hypothetical protein
MAEASGLFNFGRNMGNALGISILIAYLDRDSQANWNVLSSHIKTTNPNFIHWLNSNGYSLADPHTLAKLANTIVTQANFVAYLHTFQVGALIILAACLMTQIMKAPQKGQGVAAEVH